MAYIPPNANGQATSANSSPVVLASDQTAIPIKGNLGTNSTVSWTSATALNTAVGVDAGNYNAVSVTMSNTSTMTAGVISFEVSPDATSVSTGTWFSVALARIDTYTVETTYTLNTVANRAWTTSIDGFKWFRVRLSTVITGTGTATINVTPQTFSLEPIVTVGQATASNLNTTVANLPAAAASADALGNPTTAQIGADSLQYNGSNWDRVRNNNNSTTGDTGAKTASFNGATVVNFNARGTIITVLFGTVSGTSPTIALQLQWSFDGGTTWLNFGTPISAFTPASGNTATFIVYPTQVSDDTTATLAAFTVGATQSKFLNAPLPRNWRVAYTIAGTTPSIALTAVYYNNIN